MPTVLITPEAMRDVSGPYLKILLDAGFEIRHPDVVGSPHLAGSEGSLESMGIEAATSITNLDGGEWPDGAVVNQELRDGWKWRS